MEGVEPPSPREFQSIFIVSTIFRGVDNHPPGNGCGYFLEPHNVLTICLLTGQEATVNSGDQYTLCIFH